MRVLRATAALLALAAGLLAMPVHAADTSLSLTLAQRWQTTANAGAWTAYEVTVQNEGSTDFTGDVFLVPAASRSGAGSNLWPLYRAHLTVARSTARTMAFYVMQAPSGYQAEVRDGGGHTLLTASPAASATGAYAIGLLTDVHDGDSRITSLRPISSPHSIAVTRFPNAQAFPTNAVYLNGLSAVVIDDFDTGSLSQAQIQSLRDFVGLGGSLVITGGGAWRRTLQPLPAELLPLRPTASAVASLAPLAGLADLGREAALLTAPIVTGDLRGGRSVLANPGEAPLEVEGRYGAGRIVEVTFDPMAAPLDANAEMATLSWSQALSRGVVGMSTTGVKGFGPGPSSGLGGMVYVAAVRPQPAAPAGSSGGFAVGPPVGNGASESAVFSLLRDTPEASVPPLGLMAGLLVGYILLTGPLAYLGLRAIRRRELMWVAVPSLAILFTGIAYSAGIGSRGSDFFDNMVEIQHLAPDGAVESHGYHGLFAPHRGDFLVRVPGNTLVTSVLGSFESYSNSASQGVVHLGSKPELEVSGVAVWSMQTVQTLAVSHQPVAIEAHLSVVGSHVHGTVVNRSQFGLERLELVAGETGAVARLLGSLAPGATATVDGDLVARGAAGLPPIKGGAPQPQPAGPLPQAGSDKKDTVLGLAAGEAVTSNPGDYSLVAVSGAVGGLEVGTGRPTRSALAAVISPVALDSIDSIPAGGQKARIVSSYFGSLRSAVDVYDLEVPTGVRVTPKLAYQLTSAAPGLPPDRIPVQSMDIYDWDNGLWLPLQRQSFGPATQAAPVTLTAGEVRNGLVRVRARETVSGNANLRLVPGDAGR